jgi:hypothetical protein
MSNEETLEALHNPKPGMVFQEVYSPKIIVDFVDHGIVMWHDDYSNLPQAATVETFVSHFVSLDRTRSCVSLLPPASSYIAENI